MKPVHKGPELVKLVIREQITWNYANIEIYITVYYYNSCYSKKIMQTEPPSTPARSWRGYINVYNHLHQPYFEDW